jgi:hypothetical protein
MVASGITSKMGLGRLFKNPLNQPRERLGEDLDQVYDGRLKVSAFSAINRLVQVLGDTPSC